MAVSAVTSHVTDPADDNGYVVTRQEGSRNLIEPLTSEWTALCAEGPCDEPFYSPVWVRAYFVAFAPQTSMTLITVRHHGALRAVLPLTEWSIGFGPLQLRCLRSAANSHFPRFDVVHGTGDQEAVTQALWDFLRNWSGWDILQFESAPSRGIAWRLLELADDVGHATRHHRPDASPYVDVTRFPRGIDEIITSRTKNLRSQCRKSLKRLRAMGKVEFRIISSGSPREEISAAVDAFYRQEAGGWKGEANTAILDDAGTRLFYDLVVANAKDEGALTITQLLCGDTLVASCLQLTCKDTMYQLKSSYDEAYRTSSPGHLLKAYTLDAAPDLGITVLDNCGRSAEDKLAWTSLSRPFATCFVFNRNLRGYLAWTALFQVALPVKKWLATSPISGFIKRLLDKSR